MIYFSSSLMREICWSVSRGFGRLVIRVRKLCAIAEALTVIWEIESWIEKKEGKEKITAQLGQVRYEFMVDR